MELLAVIQWLGWPSFITIAVYGVALAVMYIPQLDWFHRTVYKTFSWPEVLMILVSAWYQYAVVSPSTGVESLLKSFTWLIAGFAFFRPWARTLVE